MRVLVLYFIASLAVQATAQTKKPAPKPSAAPAKQSTAATPAGPLLRHRTPYDEDDLVRIYSGDFQSVRLDRTSTEEFMMIISELHERLRPRLQPIPAAQ